MTAKYVIHDPDSDGYAVNNPLEGWIFTHLMSAATKFDSREDAVEAMDNYPAHPRLTVKTCLPVQLKK